MDDNSEQRIEMDENYAETVETKNDNAELEKQTMEPSSAMDNKNASAEIENKQQISNKKSLKFGGWLPDVLDWFKRPELAQTSLPTSSYTFHQYCHRRLHGNKVKPRIVRQLTIVGMRDPADNWQTILFKNGDIQFPIPIADVKPPEYIIGFDGIYFSGFINDRILQFVENILPLLKEDVRIYSQLNKIHFMQIGSINRMMELLAPKIYELDFTPTFFNELNKFNQQFPNFIPGLRSIGLHEVCSVNEMDLALKWLTTPREDGKSKMLDIQIYNHIFHHECHAIITKLIERVKEEFIKSTEPANFIISCFGIIYAMSHLNLEDFKIENKATKEVLELQRERTNKYLLIRHKNDSETKTEVEYTYKTLIVFM